eukprot:TRINITY_DN2143_c0_g1_i1.p1 TRINITY_DN2143_c0_g1~~TRINITY_DN2143_c0_g1_i1.p1  ORF type:complete len:528 (+),score=88.15 TRINITY_DN2143_c0_g1_i1:93-1676(+)
MYCYFFLTLLVIHNVVASTQQQYDVVVYGATASGVTAAIAVANEKKSVVIIEPGVNVGGMVSGGLGMTDKGDPSVIGGNALEFFKRVGAHYNSKDPKWTFEPHVAEDIFVNWLQDMKVTVVYQQRITQISKVGTTIQSITTNTGAQYSAKIFIDATYEGDLMALGKISYAWGREGVEQYNETYAGVLKEPWPHGGHQFRVPVNPYDDNGKLLPMVHAKGPGVIGSANKQVQSYNYRMCLTQNATNKIPLPEPENYNPANWELFRRYFSALGNQSLSLSHFMTISMMPNGKTDINNNGAISTDFINGAWEYPEADWTTREEIKNLHIQYTLEFFYFLAHDSSVPLNVRNEMLSWGLPKDEFIKTNHWPHQLYVREARRMIGEYVMTQHDRHETITKPDTVGLGSYNIDTHNAQRYATEDNTTLNEGDVEVSYPVHFELPYRALVPKSAECTNLIVPVCVSSSHIGYGPIRLEPQFMILGQSAGVAASFAIEDNVSVQSVNIEKLQKRLRELGQYLTNSDIPPSYVNKY